MRIGPLRHLVTIERRVDTPTGTGGSETTWTNVGDEWADIRYLSGLEALKSDFPVSIAKASIRMHWRDDLDATCRVVFGAVVFDVKAVLIDPRSQYIDLVCEVGANNG